VFNAGKNGDGYFDNDNLVKQVELSMDIFEEKTHGFKRALFLFDNATLHQKHMPDAPSAQKMQKSPPWWTENARHSFAGWIHSVILLPGGPSNHARMV